MKLHEIYRSRGRGYSDYEDMPEPIVSLQLYHPQTDENPEIEVEVEATSDEGQIDEITGVEIVDDFQFGGKTYKAGYEFPDELIPYVYDLEVMITKRMNDQFKQLSGISPTYASQDVAKQHGLSEEATQALYNIFAQAMKDPASAQLKIGVWANKYLGKTDPNVIDQIYKMGRYDFNQLFIDYLMQELENL